MLFAMSATQTAKQMIKRVSGALPVVGASHNKSSRNYYAFRPKNDATGTPEQYCQEHDKTESRPRLRA
jgi:hypothetical protein